MELKICTKCKTEKPRAEFRFKRFDKNGIEVLKGDCRQCERDSWQKRSPEAIESKRARDRERIKREDVRAKRRVTEQSPERLEWKRAYWKAKMKGGRYCFFMVRKCSQCHAVDSLKNKPVGKGVDMCRSCVRKIKQYKEVVCSSCGEAHIGKKVGQRCSTCAIKAQRVFHRAQDEKREMLKRGVKSEAIWKKKVFALDGWKCRLCNCKVQKKDIYAPNAAELDHIIPISKGGTHTYDNVQTLCRRCNANR